MTFKEDLERVGRLVEARLDAMLGDQGSGAAQGTTLAKAMRYAVLGGGKRLRPFLLMQSARLFGVNETAALDAGCALECVHCYSLVHDDLPAMDDDDMRRGRPTVHKAFDEATAILVGDALLTIAFETLSSPSLHEDPAIRSELVLHLARASGWQGMVLGQGLDLSIGQTSFGGDDVARMQALKTGALFRFACEAGAILGRASASERAALIAYASAFGQAFQLADDLLDAEGDAATLGKAVAKDAGQGKATLIALFGVDAA
ncbi:polyprenyl synthetase family protein, partial [Methyloceanibacter sp.]|uniref:polyprenyl synthetase family protein n=1 Tax=Methyloceanibacter sp. TaxID=1965321 RepID=UPI0039C97383